MIGPYTRETIENWAADFLHSDAAREFTPDVVQAGGEVLTAFMAAACEARGVEPADIEEADVRGALLEHVARLKLPPALQREAPGLCGAWLAWLEGEGRLGGGRMLGAFTRALRESFAERASGKPKPFTRPGSAINRNDPCPCGSGKKYKQCHGKLA